MKNKDTLQAEKTAILQKIQKAMKDDNTEDFTQAFGEFQTNIQETVMQEAHLMVQAADTTVLTSRGVRQLTSAENKYYEGVILSLIHISEPTRLGMISYAVFCLKKKKHKHQKHSSHNN